MKGLFLFLVLLSTTSAFAQIEAVREVLPVNSVALHPTPEIVQVKRDSVIIKQRRTLMMKALVCANMQGGGGYIGGERDNVHESIYLPLDKLGVTSGFGLRVHPVLHRLKFHNGIDLSGRNAAVYAILNGIVTVSGYNKIIGNYIVLNHGRYQSTYGHLSKRFFEVGERVLGGTVIGITGATGRVTGEHLHFIIKENGRLLDPMRFFADQFQLRTKQEEYAKLFIRE